MMESVLQLYGMAMVVLPVVAFVSLRKRVRHEGLSRQAALTRYAAMVVMPVLAYAVVFALALGVETVAPLSLGAEEIGESVVLAVVLGVLVWLLALAVFALGLIFVRSAASPGVSRP